MTARTRKRYRGKFIGNGPDTYTPLSERANIGVPCQSFSISPFLHQDHSESSKIALMMIFCLRQKVPKKHGTTTDEIDMLVAALQDLVAKHRP